VNIPIILHVQIREQKNDLLLPRRELGVSAGDARFLIQGISIKTCQFFNVVRRFLSKATN
jgi:hypothetical protein